MTATSAEIAAAEAVWEGAAALRPFLVEIASLQPFEGNPRRGDIETLQMSLNRWGQTKAILVDASGTRIVAGHHVVLAASANEWTHIAAIPNEFDSEEEAAAYLVADNGTHDRGDYDMRALTKQLDAADDLTGTGYTADDLADFKAQLEKLDNPAPPTLPPPTPPPPPLPEGDLHDVVLTLTGDQRAEFEEWLKIIAADMKTDGVSATVYGAVKLTALRIHQGG